MTQGKHSIHIKTVSIPKHVLLAPMCVAKHKPLWDET